MSTSIGVPKSHLRQLLGIEHLYRCAKTPFSSVILPSLSPNRWHLAIAIALSQTRGTNQKFPIRMDAKIVRTRPERQPHAELVRFNSRHVRAIPWPSGRWRARRRIDTGHAGRLHSRERARGHVQPRCRGGENVGRGKGCRRRHRSGGGPPASRDTHRRGRHSAAQRTCARRAGRPTRRAGGRVGLIAARRGASNRAARWRQQPPTRRCNRRRRAGTITVGGGRGAGAVRAL